MGEKEEGRWGGERKDKEPNKEYQRSFEEEAQA